MYLDDFNPSALVDFAFTTRSGSPPVPTTLAGTPAVSVYKANSTTQTTTGVTLTVDFDAVTGLNHVRVDTSADGTFYAAGTDFDVIITAGTVGGISVVGEVIGHFSIQNRSPLRPATAGRTLSVDASGNATAQLADGVTHGGTTAMLRLGSSTSTPAFYATNSGGVAFQCECTAGNFTAGYFKGFGSGSGLYGRGGTNGSGLLGMGSKGISALGANTGDCGLKLVGGGGSGPGANAGASALVIDGSNDYCHGIFIQAGSSAGNPINLESLGNNQAVLATVDGTADVMALVATSGNALTLTAAGAGKHDIALTGSGDILGNLTGTTGGLTAAGLSTLFTVDSTKVYADAVTGSPVKEIAGHAALTAAGLDAVLVESGITAGAGLTNDTGTQLTAINLRQALALALSALDGVLAGAGGTTVTIKQAGKPAGNTRVTATVDASGNRSALTLKVPD